jgi:hypothetical protein
MEGTGIREKGLGDILLLCPGYSVVIRSGDPQQLSYVSLLAFSNLMPHSPLTTHHSPIQSFFCEELILK